MCACGVCCVCNLADVKDKEIDHIIIIQWSIELNQIECPLFFIYFFSSVDRNSQTVSGYMQQVRHIADHILRNMNWNDCIWIGKLSSSAPGQMHAHTHTYKCSKTTYSIRSWYRSKSIEWHLMPIGCYWPHIERFQEQKATNERYVACRWNGNAR